MWTRVKTVSNLHNGILQKNCFPNETIEDLSIYKMPVFYYASDACIDRMLLVIVIKEVWLISCNHVSVLLYK